MNEFQRYAYEHPFTRADPLTENHYRRTRDRKGNVLPVALSVNK